MKCIIKTCPSDGVRPITVVLPKGMSLGRHEIIAEEFRAEVRMCLRHHNMFVAKGFSSYSLRKEAT